MVPQDFPRYNLEEMLKIQRPNIQGFEFTSKGCKAINKIKRAFPKKGPNLCKAMSKNKLGPSCAKLRTARNNHSIDVSYESYAKNVIHLGNLNNVHSMQNIR